MYIKKTLISTLQVIPLFHLAIFVLTVVSLAWKTFCFSLGNVAYFCVFFSDSRKYKIALYGLNFTRSAEPNFVEINNYCSDGENNESIASFQRSFTKTCLWRRLRFIKFKILQTGTSQVQFVSLASGTEACLSTYSYINILRGFQQ